LGHLLVFTNQCGNLNCNLIQQKFSFNVEIAQLV
jgi:hypothetical protein